MHIVFCISLKLLQTFPGTLSLSLKYAESPWNAVTFCKSLKFWISTQMAFSEFIHFLKPRILSESQRLAPSVYHSSFSFHWWAPGQDRCCFRQKLPPYSPLRISPTALHWKPLPCFRRKWRSDPFPQRSFSLNSSKRREPGPLEPVKPKFEFSFPHLTFCVTLSKLLFPSLSLFPSLGELVWDWRSEAGDICVGVSRASGRERK